MNIWKFKVPNRLPAHLCACALLGRVGSAVVAVPHNQEETVCPSHLPDLKCTGTHENMTQNKSRLQKCYLHMCVNI